MGKKRISAARAQANSAVSKLFDLANAVDAEYAGLDKAKQKNQSEIDAALNVLRQAKEKYQSDIDAALKAFEKKKQDEQQKLVNDLNLKRKKFDEENKKLKAAIEEDRKALEAEKALMNSLGEGSRDLVKLNVGGELVTVKRSTLCQHEGSMLACMFNGRWEKSLDRDDKDRVFLDYTPQHFSLILNYLRHEAFSKHEGPRSIPKDKVPFPQDGFWDLVKFLGLETILGTKCPHTIVEKNKYITCSTPQQHKCPLKNYPAIAKTKLFLNFICSQPASTSFSEIEVYCKGGCGYRFYVNGGKWLVTEKHTVKVVILSTA